MDSQSPLIKIPKTRNRSANRDARRKQLIEATIESVAKHGFNKTTVNTVTEIAELSHGTVNFHFKSKDMLLLETMKYLIDEHLDHWKSGLEKAGEGPADQLRALIATDFDEKIINPKRLSVWFAYWGEVSTRPAYRELADKKDHERHMVISKIADKLQQETTVHINSRMFAVNFEAIVDGLWLRILLSPKDFTQKQAEQSCLAFAASTFPTYFPST